MNCGTFVKRNFNETGIHGLPYLIRKDLHWMERIFWLIMVISASYYSIYICLDQMKRFRENPVVFAAELTWDKRDFLYPGITMCSDFRNELAEREIIEENWQLTPSDTGYEYYSNFLQTLNVLHYDTLETLTPYENDSTLWTVNYVDALLKLQESKEQEDGLLSKSKNLIFAPAITEVGLCRTTSQLNRYTNPSGEIISNEVTPVEYCLFMSICITKLYPEYPDNAGVSMHLHNPFDVVSPGHITNVYLTATPGRVLTVDLDINTFSAENEVRNLPAEYRKCRYSDESNLLYFKTYTTALCCMDRRIRKAMELCQCKPHFYAAAPRLPICNIDQLLCLQRKNWTQTNCTDCVQLCEYMFYVPLQKVLSPPMQKEGFQKFERTVVIQLNLPYRGIRRRVVFSSDQLVVSFGGAVSLFLGASFMTFYTMIKLTGEFAALNCMQFWRKRKQSKRSKLRQIRGI